MPKDKTNRHFFYSNRDDFTKMGVELNRNMCSIDLYIFGHKKAKNLSSLAETIRLSGGNISYYGETTDRSLNKFYNELMYNITKETTWEAVFRIRTSRGWKKTSYGNYFSSQYNDLLRIQHIDENYAVLYTFESDNDKIPKQQDFFYIQTSLLYTNENRMRMIRVHNYVLPVINH